MEWGALISAVAVVLIAVIEAVASRDRKSAKAYREKSDRRETIRAEESRLSMELMSANCALSLITAKKVTNQKTNGDVAKAMEKAQKAQEEYDVFLRELASGQVAKA